MRRETSEREAWAKYFTWMAERHPWPADRLAALLEWAHHGEVEDKRSMPWVADEWPGREVRGGYLTGSTGSDPDLVIHAPPPTPEQIEKLRALLRPAMAQAPQALKPPEPTREERLLNRARDAERKARRIRKELRELQS